MNYWQEVLYLLSEFYAHIYILRWSISSSLYYDIIKVATILYTQGQSLILEWKLWKLRTILD